MNLKKKKWEFIGEFEERKRYQKFMYSYDNLKNKGKF